MKEELVDRFQCPGCVNGPDTKECPAYKLHSYDNGFGCAGHVPGTLIFPLGHTLYLGTPNGFNKASTKGDISSSIFIFEGDDSPRFDEFNIPFWKKFVDGFTFVRMYQPRLNNAYVFVLEGNRMDAIACTEAPDCD